jgi:AcrR family transcriptional regulator
VTTLDETRGDASGRPEDAGPQRRRGAALEDAIRQAAFDELSTAGYTAFSVEAVAARARTGKASIYRRWPTKQELVMDAVLTVLPTPADCGVELELDDSVSTVEALYGIARAIGEVLTSAAGDVMRTIKFEAASDPELAALIDQRFQAPRRAAMLALLRRGVDRGEVRSEAATQLVADVLPAILMYRAIMLREELGEPEIRQIMEQVLIPLVEVRWPRTDRNSY